VIAYPKSANLDINRLKFDIANYNIDHYTKIDFDIETQNLNTNSSLVIVRSLNDKEQGLIYFRSIIRERAVFESLKNIKYVNFIASSTNFRQINADKDYNEYLMFFVKNYSRFITSDFSDEILPGPEELLAKVQQEENELKEKGSYVSVSPTGSGLDIYSSEEPGSQHFVIAVTGPAINLKQVTTALNAHNRDEYQSANLSIDQRQVAEYQLLVVSYFKNKNEAIRYFTNTITNRKLFRSLDTLSYRNFIINDANLKKLAETKKVGEYLNFFKVKYVGSGTAESATPAKAPEYKGPYSQNVSGAQSFILIIPKEEANQDQLLESIRQFNRQNNLNSSLNVSAAMLDDFRLMVKVEGLKTQTSGLEYLRSLARDQQVYGPIQNANYRNFIMTPENEAIFMKNKNILTYMDFYKKFYLKQ
jgi:hypothetical protein